MTIKSSISLTDDQYVFAKTMVAAGEYPSVSAVLQQGIEVLRQRHEDSTAERQALRDLLAYRARSPRLSAGEFDERLNEMLSAKRKAYGLDA